MHRTTIKKFYLLLLLLAGMFACNKNPYSALDFPTKCRIPFVGNADSSSLANCVEKVRFLSLENTDSSLIYDVDRIRFANGMIYLGDFSGDKIVAHDEAGKFCFTIDKRGQGPGEYLEIKSFAVDSQYVYVLDNYNHKVFMYDCYDGSFRQAKPLPIVAWDIETLANGEFLLAFVPMSGDVNMPHSKHLLFVTDKDFNIIKRLLPYVDSENSLPYRNFFSSCDDKIIFASLLFDGYTVIPKSNVDSLYHVGIDFERPILIEHRADMKERDSHAYEYLEDVPVTCGNYVSMEVPFRDFSNVYLYDWRTGKMMQNSFENLHNAVYYPIGSYRNSFVTYLADYSLYEELVANGFEKAPQSVMEELKKEGSMLIFYEMKE